MRSTSPVARLDQRLQNLNNATIFQARRLQELKGETASLQAFAVPAMRNVPACGQAVLYTPILGESEKQVSPIGPYACVHDYVHAD